MSESTLAAIVNATVKGQKAHEQEQAPEQEAPEQEQEEAPEQDEKALNSLLRKAELAGRRMKSACDDSREITSS
jgi:hypothetical protein